PRVPALPAQARPRVSAITRPARRARQLLDPLRGQRACLAGRASTFPAAFLPTSSSWLNLVESVFADLTKRRLRRGTFPSLDHLVKAIVEYLDQRNRDPKPFVWTASVESILAKLRS